MRRLPSEGDPSFPHSHHLFSPHEAAEGSGSVLLCRACTPPPEDSVTSLPPLEIGVAYVGGLQGLQRHGLGALMLEPSATIVRDRGDLVQILQPASAAPPADLDGTTSTSYNSKTHAKKTRLAGGGGSTLLCTWAGGMPAFGADDTDPLAPPVVLVSSGDRIGATIDPAAPPSKASPGTTATTTSPSKKPGQPDPAATRPKRTVYVPKSLYVGDASVLSDGGMSRRALDGLQWAHKKLRVLPHGVGMHVPLSTNHMTIVSGIDGSASSSRGAAASPQRLTRGGAYHHHHHQPSTDVPAYCGEWQCGQRHGFGIELDLSVGDNRPRNALYGRPSASDPEVGLSGALGACADCPVCSSQRSFAPLTDFSFDGRHAAVVPAPVVYAGPQAYDAREGAGTLYFYPPAHAPLPPLLIAATWKDGHINGAAEIRATLPRTGHTIAGAGWDFDAFSFESGTLSFAPSQRALDGLWEGLLAPLDEHLATLLDGSGAAMPSPAAAADEAHVVETPYARVAAFMGKTLHSPEFAAVVTAFLKIFFRVYGPLEVPPGSDSADVMSRALRGDDDVCRSALGALVPPDMVHVLSTSARSAPVPRALDLSRIDGRPTAVSTAPVAAPTSGALIRAIDDISSFVVSLRFRLMSFVASAPHLLNRTPSRSTEAALTTLATSIAAPVEDPTASSHSVPPQLYIATCVSSSRDRPVRASAQDRQHWASLVRPDPQGSGAADDEAALGEELNVLIWDHLWPLASPLLCATAGATAELRSWVADMCLAIPNAQRLWTSNNDSDRSGPPAVRIDRRRAELLSFATRAMVIFEDGFFDLCSAIVRRAIGGTRHRSALSAAVGDLERAFIDDALEARLPTGCVHLTTVTISGDKGPSYESTAPQTRGFTRDLYILSEVLRLTAEACVAAATSVYDAAASLRPQARQVPVEEAPAGEKTSTQTTTDSMPSTPRFDGDDVAGALDDDDQGPSPAAAAAEQEALQKVLLVRDMAASLLESTLPLVLCAAVSKAPTAAMNALVVRQRCRALVSRIAIMDQIAQAGLGGAVRTPIRHLLEVRTRGLHTPASTCRVHVPVDRSVVSTFWLALERCRSRPEALAASFIQRPHGLSADASDPFANRPSAGPLVEGGSIGPSPRNNAPRAQFLPFFLHSASPSRRCDALAGASPTTSSVRQILRWRLFDLLAAGSTHTAADAIAPTAAAQTKANLHPYSLPLLPTVASARGRAEEPLLLAPTNRRTRQRSRSVGLGQQSMHVAAVVCHSVAATRDPTTAFPGMQDAVAWLAACAGTSLVTLHRHVPPAQRARVPLRTGPRWAPAGTCPSEPSRTALVVADSGFALRGPDGMLRMQLLTDLSGASSGVAPRDDYAASQRPGEGAAEGGVGSATVEGPVGSTASATAPIARVAVPQCFLSDAATFSVNIVNNATAAQLYALGRSLGLLFGLKLRMDTQSQRALKMTKVKLRRRLATVQGALTTAHDPAPPMMSATTALLSIGATPPRASAPPAAPQSATPTTSPLATTATKKKNAFITSSDTSSDDDDANTAPRAPWLQRAAQKAPPSRPQSHHGTAPNGTASKRAEAHGRPSAHSSVSAMASSFSSNSSSDDGDHRPGSGTAMGSGRARRYESSSSEDGGNGFAPDAPSRVYVFSTRFRHMHQDQPLPSKTPSPTDGGVLSLHPEPNGDTPVPKTLSRFALRHYVLEWLRALERENGFRAAQGV